MIVLAAFLVAATAAGPATHSAATRLVERAEMCLHWSGEEAYDAARRREIERGVPAAGCSMIDRDAKAFLRRAPAPADARAVKKAIAELDPS